MNIATRLKVLRAEQGWTQTQLADVSGLSWSVISKIENGKTTSPSLKTLNSLARVFGITVNELVSDTKLPASDAKLQQNSVNMRFTKIPYYGIIPVLGERFPNEPLSFKELPIEREVLDNLISAVENLFFMKVQGDDYRTTGIHNDDYIVVDRDAKFVDSKAYAVKNGDEVTVRFLTREGPEFRSLPFFGNGELLPEDSIIGRVVLYGHWNTL